MVNKQFYIKLLDFDKYIIIFFIVHQQQKAHEGTCLECAFTHVMHKYHWDHIKSVVVEASIKDRDK